MDETMRRAGEMRHLLAGWSFARRDHSAGPDGISVSGFAVHLADELAVLGDDLRRGTFRWSSLIAGDGTSPHTVRDRVAAGAIRSALREERAARPVFAEDRVDC